MAEERIEIDPTLESVLRYCLNDAKKRMEEGEVVVPFSALAVDDKLFMEEHAADNPSESFASARKTVAGARGAQAYGFCYDGYVEAEGLDGKPTTRDCIIAEGGTPGADYGHAIGLLYKYDGDGKPVFQEEPIYVSKALNYMVGLTEDGKEEIDFEVEVFTGAKDPSEEDASEAE